MYRKRNGFTKKKNNFIRFFVACSFVIAAYMGHALLEQNAAFRELESVRIAQLEEIDIMEAEIAELSEEVKQRDSMEFVERVAREKLGMIKPREYIYVDEADKEQSSEDVK